MKKFFHLVRRATTSWRNNGLSDDERSRAAQWLTAQEMQVWLLMQPRDCRHSLDVHIRFAALCPQALREEHAAALLHDVGKVQSDLGWWMRIIATVVGPRGKRFRTYHNHEALGAAMLDGLSHPRTIELISGCSNDSVSHALKVADDL